MHDLGLQIYWQARMKSPEECDSHYFKKKKTSCVHVRGSLAYHTVFDQPVLCHLSKVPYAIKRQIALVRMELSVRKTRREYRSLFRRRLRWRGSRGSSPRSSYVAPWSGGRKNPGTRRQWSAGSRSTKPQTTPLWSTPDDDSFELAISDSFRSLLLQAAVREGARSGKIGDDPPLFESFVDRLAPALTPVWICP